MPVSEDFGKCLVVLGKTYRTSANFLQRWAALHLQNTIHVDSRDAGGYSVIGSSVLHGGLQSCAFSHNHGSSATVQNGCSYFKGNDPIGDRPIFYWSLNYGKQADHARSCFWHPVRAGRPTALGNQTTTLDVNTRHTGVRFFVSSGRNPANLDVEENSRLVLFSTQNLPNKNLLDWPQLLIHVDSCLFPNLKFSNLGTRLWRYTKAKAQDIKIDFPLKTRKQDTSLLTLENLENVSWCCWFGSPRSGDQRSPTLIILTWQLFGLGRTHIAPSLNWTAGKRSQVKQCHLLIAGKSLNWKPGRFLTSKYSFQEVFLPKSQLAFTPAAPPESWCVDASHVFLMHGSQGSTKKRSRFIQQQKIRSPDLMCSKLDDVLCIFLVEIHCHCGKRMHPFSM